MGSRGSRGGGPRMAALWLALGLAACGGDPQGDPVRFSVPPGSGLSAVTDTLAAREIVRWPFAFKLYARARGSAARLKPGVYEVRPGTAWDEILERLVAGDVVKASVVIPEGWTAAQIAQRIAAAAGEPPNTVLQLLLGDSAAEKASAPGPTLEGYLYPATYVFPLGTPAERMVAAMVRRYKQVWTPELRVRADSVGLSEVQAVTLASIIEKEAKRWTERDTISAVYHNRLRIGMPLQADPTVQYALGAHQSRLLYSHIRDVADNPYNTYTNRGLPPGPIASPSEGAIRAALYPADVDFLYFVARPDGSHVFTRSLAEHNAAKNRIRRMMDSVPPAR